MAKTNPTGPRPLGNRARTAVEDAQTHVREAQKRYRVIDREAERVDELGALALTELQAGNYDAVAYLLLDMRTAAANVRRHEQTAAAECASAQDVLARAVRGEWE